MDPRDQRITELTAIVAKQQTIINTLTAEISQLKILNAELREKLNQNSRNSHLSPSSDGPGARTRDKPKNKPKKKNKGEKNRQQGAQPGHRGSSRNLLPSDQVGHIVDHFPSECKDCGAKLPKVEDSNPVRTQVTEVPPIKPIVTEHRQHAVACSCGCITRANSEAVPSSSFGPRLMSLVALFTGFYHISRRNTVNIMHDVLGVQMSLGSVSNIEGRVSTALKPAVNEAWSELDKATVKHADATSWLQNGKLQSLWVLASGMVTVFKILIDGSTATIKPIFGDCLGILVSDRAKVFTFWKMAKRQVCWAHLVRKFIYFFERDGPSRKIGKELLDYTELIFNYWHGYKNGKLSKKEFQAWMAVVQVNVEACLQRAVAAGIKNVSGSCADILAHKEALWTFVTHPGVGPTNNHAERELRAFVLWRRRCFGSQSERGNLFAERIMTVAHTARKQNLNVLAFLTDSCKAMLDGAEAPSLFSQQRVAA